MSSFSLLRRFFALCSALCCAVTSPAAAQSGTSTPDALVDALCQSVEQRSVVTYDLLLDPEFRFHLAPEDVDGSTAFLDRAFELAAVERVFSGAAGTGPGGGLRPGVQSIEVTAFPLDDWSDGGAAGAEFVGTQRRRWAIEFYVRYTDPTLVTIASTEHELFVVQQW